MKLKIPIKKSRCLIFLFIILILPLSIDRQDSETIEFSSTLPNECQFFYDPKPNSVDALFFDFPPSKKPSYLINADFFTGLGKKGFNWIRHRDDQGNYWMTGFSSLSPGVSEFVLRSPTELFFQEQLLTVIDYFKTFGFSQVPKSKMGLVIQMESGKAPYNRGPARNFHFYRLSQLEQLKTEGLLPEPQINAFENYLDFQLAGYSRRMKISEENQNKLRKISMDLKSRSHLLFMSQEGMVEYRDQLSLGVVRYDRKMYQDHQKNPDAFPTRVLPDKFTFIGGAIFVTSRSEKELLPLEVFTGFRVPRKSGVTAEIGRFYVDRIHRDPNTSYAIVGLIGSLLTAAKDKQIGNVDQIVIEADEARAQIFSEYGFVAVHEQTNFQGRKEFIMTASPETVTERSKEKLLNDLDRLKKYPATILFRPKEIQLVVSRASYWDPKDFRGPLHTFGSSGLTILMNDLYDLNLSSIDFKDKVRQSRQSIQINFPELSHAFDVNPHANTEKLLQAIGTDVVSFLKEIRVMRKPYMSDQEYANTYLGELVMTAFSKLDAIMPLYPNKFEQLRVIDEYLESNREVWYALHGDHGKTYLLLDYYLKGSPSYTPTMSFKKAYERNNGSDLNIFEVTYPEPPLEMRQLLSKASGLRLGNQDLVDTKKELYRIYTANSKLNETSFESIWELFLKTARIEKDDDSEFQHYFTYYFWHRLVIMSKYIEDIRFKQRSK